MIEFAHINEKATLFFEFLKDKFSEVALIEAVNTFYRFKIEKQVNLSALFGAIEPNVLSA